METLMTVLKRFWPNYKLKKTLSQRKSASRKQDRKDVFGDRYNRPLSLRGHVESQENKKLCFCTVSLASELASDRGLPCENKAFYSPETQHGRRVIRVYSEQSTTRSG